MSNLAFFPFVPRWFTPRASPALTPAGKEISLTGMRRGIVLLVAMGWAPWARALPPSDYFEPDLTMYSFADLWVIRPISAAILPVTMTTFTVGAPLTAGSGRDSVQRSYDLLVGDPAQFLMARPLGSFFDWENRDRTKPVVIKFPDGYTMAELSPQQERRYRVALQDHEARIRAIEDEKELPEADRKALVGSEERRWEKVLRLLLSL